MSKSIVYRAIIKAAKAPKPVGPYNQAVKVGSTVYVSGVLGIDASTEKLVSGGASGEANQALTNLGYILTEADATYDNVVKTTIFLDDINDFTAVNDVYKKFFKEPFPARSTFQVGKLPLNAKVEIEVIAVTGRLLERPPLADSSEVNARYINDTDDPDYKPY